MDEHVRRALSEVQIGCTSWCRHRRLLARLVSSLRTQPFEPVSTVKRSRTSASQSTSCAICVMSATDHFIDLWVVSVDNRVIAQGHAQSRPGARQHTPGELSALILDSTADYYDVETSDGEINFAVVKQARTVLADQR